MGVLKRVSEENRREENESLGENRNNRLPSQLARWLQSREEGVAMMRRIGMNEGKG